MNSDRDVFVAVDGHILGNLRDATGDLVGKGRIGGDGLAREIPNFDLLDGLGQVDGIFQGLLKRLSASGFDRVGNVRLDKPDGKRCLIGDVLLNLQIFLSPGHQTGNEPSHDRCRQQ